MAYPVPRNRRRTAAREMPTLDRSRELDRVRNWRRRCLLQMGVSRSYARLLADSDADLHQMLALLRHGATVDEVRRIVL